MCREGRNYFAFIVNQSWLLCYFRAPAFTDGFFVEKDVLERFSGAESAGKDIKLKVHDFDEAKAVAEYVFACLA